jgi:hypothetical protein
VPFGDSSSSSVQSSRRSGAVPPIWTGVLLDRVDATVPAVTRRPHAAYPVLDTERRLSSRLTHAQRLAFQIIQQHVIGVLSNQHPCRGSGCGALSITLVLPPTPTCMRRRRGRRNDYSITRKLQTARLITTGIEENPQCMKVVELIQTGPHCIDERDVDHSKPASDCQRSRQSGRASQSGRAETDTPFRLSRFGLQFQARSRDFRIAALMRRSQR